MNDDPIRVADANWRRGGWDTGDHFAASVSIYRTDEQIRELDDLTLRPRGLTRSRHEALAVLCFSRQGEMLLSALSARLFVHPTSVTTTVDTLERLGLVERVRHPTDRRATLARVTSEGRRVMDHTCGLMAQNRCGLAALDERRAARLFGILEKVRADAGDLKPDEAPPGSSRTVGVEDPVLRAERNWVAHGWAAGPWFRASLSIYRTAELIRQSNESALRPHHLTHVRHEALAVLYFSSRGEMPMGRLGARLLVHPTSVTSTVDALERLGLVARVAHPTDRRATLARITATGRRAVEGTNEAMAETHFGLAALTDAQARAVYSILAKVRLAG